VALRHISLRDFVIVRQLDLDLSQGFSVLTGETGAGKSILIDALQLALGERADASVVREGATRCEVSAEFDCPPQAHAVLEDAGFEVADTLLLRRSVDPQGKSRAWVNGTAATATQLRALGQMLLDIHGQHAWQSLTAASCATSAHCTRLTQPRTRAIGLANWRTRQTGTRHGRVGRAQLTAHSAFTCTSPD